jgi:hypothetical protein
MTDDIYKLIESEGWSIFRDSDEKEWIQAEDELFPVSHPVNVHLKLYRTSKNPERAYIHMKAAHDYLWPGEKVTWNYWEERRFRAHCQGYNYITYAGGANCAKSYTAAKIALLFWLANPTKRGVIVASTTLASLEARIWGYVKKFLQKVAIPLPVTYTGSPNPKILYNTKKAEGLKNVKDSIHGMFAIAAKKGDDDEAISGWIGRHPEDKILLVLDEATDMPLSIIKAFPNLEAKPDKFQCMAIGNSLSKFDLHGSLSTPRDGWQSVNPMEQFEWPTTQRNGICLFFNCYDSPAIHEVDPRKKAILSEFLITAEEIQAKEKTFGKDSESFYRFVLGFWKSSSSSETVINIDYIERFRVKEMAEWSGMYPLKFIGGLDPAFTTNGDGCILQGGLLGVDINGRMVLDFRQDKLLHRIPLVANTSKSIDLQIADAVIEWCQDTGIALEDLFIDANGAGWGLAETIRLRKNYYRLPKKVITSRLGNNLVKPEEHNYVVRSAYDLWFNFRTFIEHQQIKGLNNNAIIQLTNRLVIVGTNGKPKMETKQEYKRRIGMIMRSQAKSPDEADAASLTLLCAMVNYGFHPGQSYNVSESPMLEKIYYAHREASIGMQNHAVKKGVPRGMLQMNFTSDITGVANKKLF